MKKIEELKKEKFPDLINEKDFNNNILKFSSNKKEMLYTIFLRESKENSIGTLLFSVINNKEKINDVINDYINIISNISDMNFDEILVEKDVCLSAANFLEYNLFQLFKELFTNLLDEFRENRKSLINSNNTLIKLKDNGEDKNGKQYLVKKIEENKIKLEEYNLEYLIRENIKLKESINEAIDSINSLIYQDTKSKIDISYKFTVPRMKVVNKNNEETIYFEIKDFYDFINANIYYFIQKKIYLRRCKNCGKYFIKRGKQIYCDNIYEITGMTCREMLDYQRNKDENDPQVIYRGEYLKQNAKKNRNKNNNPKIKEKFANWNNSATNMREKAKKGLISSEELKEWFDNNKDWINKEVDNNGSTRNRKK